MYPVYPFGTSTPQTLRTKRSPSAPSLARSRQAWLSSVRVVPRERKPHTVRAKTSAPSTASQTAWALLGLMAAGEVEHPAVKRGIDYLSRMQGNDGFWDEPRYTATGFPRVFYLRYHGYSKFFPLWALARYRNLRNSNARTVAYGM